MTRNQRIALSISAGLWVVWGLVHILAAFLIVPVDASTAIGNIADAVDKSTLVMDYPPALKGILSQHGFNLGWIGLTTLVGAVFIARGNPTAIWVTALVGGMADVGYFLFIDIPGYSHFVPGTLMTIFSGSAIVLSGWVWLTRRA